MKYCWEWVSVFKNHQGIIGGAFDAKDLYTAIESLKTKVSDINNVRLFCDTDDGFIQVHPKEVGDIVNVTA